jgi:hypothetical protein
VRERNHRTRDELGKRIARVASKHNLQIELPGQEVTWRTKLAVVCPRCGHKRRTDVPALLTRPDACRRCNKRMPVEKLRSKLAERAINLDRVEYPSASAENGQGIAHCLCKACHQRFRRRIGELVSGNRGCPNCLNVQERDVRVILAHNFGGTFAIRKRPPWMKGLELDGWNTEIAIKGQSLAFEYMGRYWHRGDDIDRAKVELKTKLCAQNGVILLVVWGIADRPSWEQQLMACQKAVDAVDLALKLEMPPASVREQLAKAVPKEIRDQLAAINHDALEYDSNGNIRSACRLTGKIVRQAPYSLRNIRGCRYCQNHPSKSVERQFNARKGARAMWEAHRQGSRYSYVKVTDDIVAYIRNRDFPSDEVMSKEVENHFGVKISPSGLQYARSGRTHFHLNEKHSPVRKSASPYRKDHPAVIMTNSLRKQGLSFGKISKVLFDKGYGTLKGTAFSAAQVKLFTRWPLSPRTVGGRPAGARAAVIASAEGPQ